MNYDDLLERTEAFFAVEVEEYFLLYGSSARAFIAGLAAFKIYRNTVGDSLWKSRGFERMKEFRLWADQGSSWNFEHKLHLMEAEHSYCCGNLDQAAESYKKAIISARAHKYINDEALACELAGKFYLDRGNISLSLEYLRLAHEKYSEWKADGKANQLFGFINSKFAHKVRARHLPQSLVELTKRMA
eukprot:scaffold70262_cov88-Cyclotella_meneghiniana.AAC.4